MRKHRVLIAAFLGFWLVLGPAVTMWAASGATPCESMASSMAADDCCGDGMDQAACSSVCAAVSAVIAGAATRATRTVPTGAVVPVDPIRYAGLTAPPDIAPPKTSVS